MRRRYIDIVIDMELLLSGPVQNFILFPMVQYLPRLGSV